MVTKGERGDKLGDWDGHVNTCTSIYEMGLPRWLGGKEFAYQCRRCKRRGFDPWVRYLGQEDSLEKEMATHFSILAWEIPWIEEPGGLQSM